MLETKKNCNKLVFICPNFKMSLKLTAFLSNKSYQSIFFSPTTDRKLTNTLSESSSLYVNYNDNDTATKYISKLLPQ